MQIAQVALLAENVSPRRYRGTERSVSFVYEDVAATT
ncbi:UNVERIFIED_ORG: hypothetical protein GGD48_004934 [Rhizobium etli]